MLACTNEADARDDRGLRDHQPSWLPFVVWQSNDGEDQFAEHRAALIASRNLPFV